LRNGQVLSRNDAAKQEASCQSSKSFPESGLEHLVESALSRHGVLLFLIAANDADTRMVREQRDCF
jgi:hypothetical protein